jgi:hypothetical protein
LTARQVETLWEELANSDAVVAYKAIWALASAPERTIALLKERAQPLAPIDEKQAEGFIKDLDSDRFAVREQASKGLEGLGEAAESIMQKTLKGNPTLEVRRRLEHLLQRLPLGPKQLQMLRATEVLEQIGSPGAREVLERLADGMPEARLTLEARASLERLRAGDATMKKQRNEN